MLSPWLILSENKGILTTKSKGKITERTIRNRKSMKIGNKSKLISGIAAITIANAGVGKPIKEVVCLVSILNFAKRIAEKIGIKKAINDGLKSV